MVTMGGVTLLVLMESVMVYVVLAGNVLGCVEIGRAHV